jgi:hypothetical protein
MPTSNSPLAYGDVQAIMDRALANDRGVRVACRDVGEANNLRNKCYNLRAIDRRESRHVFKPEDRMFGRSVYDQLSFTPMQDAGRVFLVVEVTNEERLQARVEDL